MKRIKQVLFVAVVTAFASLPLMVIGVGSDPFKPSDHPGFSATDAEKAAPTLTNATVFDLVTNVMDWLLGLVGVLAVIGFVIAGVLYLTSAGDEEQAEKAKSIMTYAIIGLAVALVGLIVVNAVAGLTGAADVSSY